MPGFDGILSGLRRAEQQLERQLAGVRNAISSLSFGSAVSPPSLSGIKRAFKELRPETADDVSCSESKTGIPGRFDVSTSWQPDSAALDPNDSRPSLFTALQEQLGLKLDSQRRPVDVLVIDAIERPTLNFNAATGHWLQAAMS